MAYKISCTNIEFVDIVKYGKSRVIGSLVLQIKDVTRSTVLLSHLSLFLLVFDSELSHTSTGPPVAYHWTKQLQFKVHQTELVLIKMDTVGLWSATLSNEK